MKDRNAPLRCWCAVALVVGCAKTAPTPAQPEPQAAMLPLQAPGPPPHVPSPMERFEVSLDALRRDGPRWSRSQLGLPILGPCASDPFCVSFFATDARPNAHNHVQGIVEAHLHDGQTFVVVSHSRRARAGDGALHGALLVAQQDASGAGPVQYVFETLGWHPSSVAATGRFVLWTDAKSIAHGGRSIYVMDLAQLDVHAGSTTTPVFVAHGASPPFPTIPSMKSIGTGGGGLAITRMADGRHLLAVGLLGGHARGGPQFEPGSKNVEIRFFVLDGDLARPAEMTSRVLDTLVFSAADPRVEPMPDGTRPGHDENLSLFTGPDGAPYLFIPDYHDEFFIYRIDVSPDATRVTAKAVLHTAGRTRADPGDIGIYPRKRDPRVCDVRGGVSASVTTDGRLQILCAERTIRDTPGPPPSRVLPFAAHR